jgi:hypothetical protein
LCLKKSDARVYDLILGLPFGRVRLADRLEEAIVWLWAEQVARREMDVNLEALGSFAAQVWELVLERPDGTSSLEASLSSSTELIEDHIDAVAANGVCWGTWSALAAALSYLLELGTELELLGPGRNVDLPDGRSDGCPLDPGTLGLRFSGIIHLSNGCSWLPRWRERGVVVVLPSLLYFYSHVTM